MDNETLIAAVETLGRALGEIEDIDVVVAQVVELIYYAANGDKEDMIEIASLVEEIIWTK